MTEAVNASPTNEPWVITNLGTRAINIQGVVIEPGESGSFDMKVRPPDRLAVDPKSPYYDKALLARGIAVLFKGVERVNVAEYCVSEGWVRRIPAGGSYKNTVKMQGQVEVWFRT